MELIRNMYMYPSSIQYPVDGVIVRVKFIKRSGKFLCSEGIQVAVALR